MESLGNFIDKISVLRLDYDKLKGEQEDFVTSSQVCLSFCTLSLAISL